MLVGRDGELAVLAEHLAHDRPVVLVGEAGVGKTALLRAAAAATGRAVFEGGALATLSWMEHLALRRALGAPVRGGDAMAVAEEMERAVATGVLVLDDLQWADPATAETVGLLAGRLSLVAGVRRGDPGADPMVDRLRHAGFEEVHLSPLDEVSAAELVRSLRPELGAAVIDRLVRRTGGNPLLLHEMSATGEPSPSLRLALGARLRLLDVEGRAAFGMLALAGRPVAVKDLTPAGSKSLMGADLVVVDSAGVAVRHALLAEVAIELMEPEERCALHARLARVMVDPGEAARHHAQAGEIDLAYTEALRAAEMAERPGERASHLVVAAECASGPEADSLRLRAAKALDEGLDWAGVVATVDRIVSNDAQVRAWSALLRARAAWVGAGAEALRAALAEGLALADGSGTEVEVRLRIEESRLPLFVDCDYAEGVRMAAAALDLARRTGIDVPRAEYLLGSALGLSAGSGWTDHLGAAIAGARASGDIQTEFLAANNLISFHESLGSPLEGRRIALKMIERAHALGLGYWERGLQSMVVSLDLHAGDYGAVLREAEALLAQPLDPRARDIVVKALCMVLIDVGRFEEVARRTAVARHQSVRDYRGKQQLGLVKAEAALWGGQPYRALELTDDLLNETSDRNAILVRVTRAWACVEVGHDPGPAIEAQTWPMLFAAPEETAALRFLHLGENRAAAERFQIAASLWQPYHRRGELRCAWAAGEALRRAGDLAGALARLEVVEVRADELGLGPLLGRIRQSLRAAGRRRSAPRAIGRDGLSGREMEVLRLVAEGLTNSQIAARLGVTRSTVAAQLASASAKLGATSRSQAASLVGPEVG